MKKIDRKIGVLAFLMAGVLSLSDAAALTVIVNTVASEQTEPDDNTGLYEQAVETGIMNVLFDRGHIVFSQTSAAGDEHLLGIARKTGADFIISWNLEDQGLSGRLIDTKSGKAGSLLTLEEGAVYGFGNTAV